MRVIHFHTKARLSLIQNSPLKSDQADQITTMKKEDGNIVM